MSNSNKKRGAVSLEALLSLILMFLVLVLAWSVAQYIYEFTRLSNVSQLAAQGALQTFVRDIPPTNSCTGGVCDAAIQRSEDVAGRVVRDNFCPPNRPGGAGGGRSFAGFSRLSAACGSNIVSVMNYTWLCGNIDCRYSGNIRKVTLRLTVRGRFPESPSPFSSGGVLRNRDFTAIASVYRGGP